MAEREAVVPRDPYLELTPNKTQRGLGFEFAVSLLKHLVRSILSNISSLGGDAT